MYRMVSDDDDDNDVRFSFLKKVVGVSFADWIGIININKSEK